ncbi:MAG: hypothetical protein V3U19_09540 [Thermodesulfobacteriota bacterium]
MKAWKKGAVIGALWGSILGNLVYYIIGMIYWEGTPPTFLEEILSLIVYFPVYITKIFPEQLELYLTKNVVYTILFYYGFNLVGWIIIGAVVGYLYGRRRTAK